jgi:hypothetical protein
MRARVGIVIDCRRDFMTLRNRSVTVGVLTYVLWCPVRYRTVNLVDIPSPPVEVS